MLDTRPISKSFDISRFF